MSLSLFPGAHTAGRPAVAAALRAHADRTERRAQRLALVEDALAASARRPAPTAADAARAARLTRRYVHAVGLARTLRDLADAHDAFDLPAELLGVDRPRAVATLLAADPVDAERAAPLGQALAWARALGLPRACAVERAADALAALDPLRPFPLPLAVRQALGGTPGLPGVPPWTDGLAFGHL